MPHTLYPRLTASLGVDTVRGTQTSSFPVGSLDLASAVFCAASFNRPPSNSSMTSGLSPVGVKLERSAFFSFSLYLFPEQHSHLVVSRETCYC